jgi:plastocyanin
MNSKIILGIVLAVLFFGSIYLLLSKNANFPTQNQNSQTQNAQPTNTQTKQQDANVTVDANGFNPQTLTIKRGTRVVWTNKSGGPVTVNSDVHPTHLLFPFLNLGEFNDGSSVSVVFDKSGRYTYHNHLNPSQTGTVIVQ